MDVVLKNVSYAKAMEKQFKQKQTVSKWSCYRIEVFQKKGEKGSSVVKFHAFNRLVNLISNLFRFITKKKTDHYLISKAQKELGGKEFSLVSKLSKAVEKFEKSFYAYSAAKETWHKNDLNKKFKAAKDDLKTQVIALSDKYSIDAIETFALTLEGPKPLYPSDGRSKVAKKIIEGVKKQEFTVGNSVSAPITKKLECARPKADPKTTLSEADKKALKQTAEEFNKAFLKIVPDADYEKAASAKKGAKAALRDLPVKDVHEVRKRFPSVPGEKNKTEYWLNKLSALQPILFG